MKPFDSFVEFFKVCFCFFLNPGVGFVEFDSFLINKRKDLNGLIISSFSVFVLIGSVDNGRIYILDGFEMFLKIYFFSSPCIFIKPLNFL